MKALRVGIIGCGGRGWAHASGYKAAGDRVILAACADIPAGVEAASAAAGEDGAVCAVGSLYMAGAVRACFGLY